MKGIGLLTVLCGILLVLAGMASLSASGNGVARDVKFLNRSEILETRGYDFGDCGEIHGPNCFALYRLVDKTCTTEEPVWPCKGIGFPLCGASVCYTDCSPLPEYHFTPSGDMWGWADCTGDCGDAGSTYDMRLCVWIDIEGICSCSGTVVISDVNCHQRGCYCRFHESSP